MPSPIFHMAIAKKINEKLNYDLDLFMLGNLITDFATWEKTKNTHEVTHFQKDTNSGLANPDLFLQKYPHLMKNVLAMGYLTHLLTDRYFNKFMFDNFFVYEKERPIGIKLKNGRIKRLNKRECKNMKHDEFSEFEKELVHSKYITHLENKCSKLPEIEEMNNFTIDEVQTAIDGINFLIKSKKKLILFSNYKIVNKKRMHEEFDKCCNYIINYLKENNLIKKGS